MRRHGKLTLLQLAIRSGKVWLIDVSTLGDRAFTTAARSDAKTTLKSILQSRSARKVSTIRTTGSPCQHNASRRIMQSATSIRSFVVIHSRCTWQHARLDNSTKPCSFNCLRIHQRRPIVWLSRRLDLMCGKTATLCTTSSRCILLAPAELIILLVRAGHRQMSCRVQTQMSNREPASYNQLTDPLGPFRQPHAPVCGARYGCRVCMICSLQKYQSAERWGTGCDLCLALARYAS